jgi:hypothetical protein
MLQSPTWEDDSSSASQEILHFLWGQKIHYRIHRNPSEEAESDPLNQTQFL